MGVMLKCGAVFLHIPKTGGSWVEKALKAIGQAERLLYHRHADMTRVMHYSKFEPPPKRKGLKKWVEFRPHTRQAATTTPFRFCFVRHPLHWYESSWRYMEGKKWNHWGRQAAAHDWHPSSPLNGLGDPDFNQFLRNVIRVRPGYVTELYSRYTEEGIEFIGRQEDLVEGLIHVLRLLNVSFDEQIIRNLGPENVSPTPQARIRWDPQLRALITRLEYPSLVRYGYVQDEMQALLDQPELRIRIAA
jgi:hypothetical protein